LSSAFTQTAAKVHLHLTALMSQSSEVVVVSVVVVVVGVGMTSNARLGRLCGRLKCMKGYSHRLCL